MEVDMEFAEGGPDTRGVEIHALAAVVAGTTNHLEIETMQCVRHQCGIIDRVREVKVAFIIGISDHRLRVRLSLRHSSLRTIAVQISTTSKTAAARAQY